jgi:hypothetical protein
MLMRPMGRSMMIVRYTEQSETLIQILDDDLSTLWVEVDSVRVYEWKYQPGVLPAFTNAYAKARGFIEGIIWAKGMEK